MNSRPSGPKSDVSGTTESAFLVLVGGLTAVVLVLTAEYQIFDTNFYTLWEATALLAGDHPYRDFFEWGVPLQAVVSAAAQLLTGYRLIGEFLVQWSFIVAGVVISFHLGLRLSHSVGASLVMMFLMLPILAATPTFHYPKLFFYPSAVWLAWWYMDRPGATRSAALGLATAVAFLFRHDHGVYIGGAALLAFALARAAGTGSRAVPRALAEGVAYLGVAAVVLAPWLILVQMNEGVPQYVRSRAFLYNEWSAKSSPYRTLLNMNPRRALDPDRPPPTQAVVSFEWSSSVDAPRRHQLERQYGLRWLRGPDSRSRWHYEVRDAYDVRLLDLNAFINDTDGFDWDRLQRLRWRLPSRANALSWLEQTALLVPLLLLVSAGIDLLRSWRRTGPIPLDTWRIVLAATFLAVLDARLLREASYVVVVAPLTAALGARLLAGKRRVEQNATPLARYWSAARAAIAAGMLLVTGVTVFAYTRDTNIFVPLALVDNLRPAFAQLLASPPIDGYQPGEPALRYDREAWNSGVGDKGRLMLRYLHDCTRAGDRVLVTGSTPYQVSYYVRRPIAGGHLFWHHRWRADAPHEMQSLALLHRQSVPFAFSTHDPVLEDFKSYPNIREYLVKHYVELEGSGGLLLIDKRRRPSGTFGAVGFPCFR